MTRYFQVCLISVCGFLGWVALPSNVWAGTIDLSNVSPAVDEDITPPDDSQGEAENFHTFWFKGQIDTQYTTTFDVSEEPAFTFVSGGDMTLENNVLYNADTGEFTVTYTAKALQQIDANSGLELEEGQTLTIIAVSFPVAEGQEGPGENTKGSWIATAFQEWTLSMPSEESNILGATVSGDGGDSGRFKMFIPAASMQTMAEYDGAEEGEEYAAHDFAIYQDGAQVSTAVEDVDGGSYIDFDTTLSEEESEEEGGEGEGDGQEGQRVAADGPGVTEEVGVGPRAPISLKTNKETVSEGTKVTLTGWIKSGKKNKQVVLLQLTEEGGTYKKVKTTETIKGGKFQFKVKVNQSIRYKVKFKSKKSTAVDILVQS